MDKNLLILIILKYCRNTRDMLDRQADAGFSTDVDIGRSYEPSRIIESEVKTND